MIVLVIRTDTEQAHVALYDDKTLLAEKNWQASRTLADTLHISIAEVFEKANKQLADLNGIVAYQGPGSFTGLRIGIAVASAMAYSLRVPIVAGAGDYWIQNGLNELFNGVNDTVVQPEYGAGPRITQQKR